MSDKNKPTTHVIIVAAGRGSRFGGDMPKQFCLLGDRPVLMHTVISIGRALPQAEIVIVLSQEYIDFWEKMCQLYGFVSPRVVAGGSTRWESVLNAIRSLDTDDGDIIMVHDGVRPIVQKEMVKRIVSAMENNDAVIPVMPVTDSLRQLDGDGQSHAVDRSHLVGVQTPQAFRAGKLRAAYELPYIETYTDDASVYESSGVGVPVLVEGSPQNIKITHPRDIDIAALFMGIR